jgi:hypothetical protein
MSTIDTTQPVNDESDDMDEVEGFGIVMDERPNPLGTFGTFGMMGTVWGGPINPGTAQGFQDVDAGRPNPGVIRGFNPQPEPPGMPTAAF